MRFLYIILVFMGLLTFSGCPKPISGGGELVAGRGPCLFAAERVQVIGLTSVKADPDDKSSSVISAYVSLHDSFGSSIKGPGVFSFELYEYVPRSSKPMGKQLFSWPEIDLNDSTVNNSHWKDFLRAYNFRLDTEIDPDVGKVYILQVTMRTPDKRLADIFYLDTIKD